MQDTRPDPFLGMPAAPHAVVTDVAEAEAAAARLGLPVWIRPGVVVAEPVCMRVDHQADVSLGVAEVRRRAPDAPALVQCVVEGHACRVVRGTLDGQAVGPVLVEEHHRDGPFRLMMGQALPGAVPGGGVPLDWPEAPWVELEFACPVSGSPVLIDVLTAQQPDPVMAELIRLAAAGGAAAVRWIRSRSGVVTRVSGEDEAAKAPNVQVVELRIRPGDTVYHEVDPAARDRLGYVIATAAEAGAAHAAASHAAGLIQVETERILR